MRLPVPRCGAVDHTVDLEALSTPVIFTSLAKSWPAAAWDAEAFAALFGGASTIARFHARSPGTVRETACAHRVVSLHEFAQWVLGRPSSAPVGGPTPAPDSPSLQSAFPRATHCGYVDYKHAADLFDTPQLLRAAESAVHWCDAGLTEQQCGPGSSTWWFGTEGAHTGLHFDSYGFNVVAQIFGHKKWILFPPSESAALQPTRLPYEESSIWSQVDVLSPLCTLDPSVRCFEAVLGPGDVLVVPKHYWHCVRCLTVSLSVNQWVSVPSDAESRIDEAITRLFVSTLSQGSAAAGASSEGLVNPTESLRSFEDNLEDLSRSLHDASLPPASFGAGSSTGLTNRSDSVDASSPQLTGDTLLHALVHCITTPAVVAHLRDQLLASAKALSSRVEPPVSACCEGAGAGAADSGSSDLPRVPKTRRLCTSPTVSISPPVSEPGAAAGPDPRMDGDSSGSLHL